MVDTPLVSLIVVSYNHSKFIVENLNSIKNQTYKNIELIVADDASSDNSVWIFDAWLKENKISAKKNYHKKNTGLSTILNECIEMATGKYIKLIAADDYFHSRYIEDCLSYLEATGLYAVFTQANLVDDTSNVILENYFPNIQYKTHEEMMEKLIENNFVPGSTLFVAKSLYDKIGKYSTDTILEDYNLALRMASSSLVIGKIDRSLIYYRSHADNITKKKHLITLHSIYEKLSANTTGKYDELIKRNIRDEVTLKSPYLKDLKILYKRLGTNDLKSSFALYLPKTYRFIKSFRKS